MTLTEIEAGEALEAFINGQDAAILNQFKVIEATGSRKEIVFRLEDIEGYNRALAEYLVEDAAHARALVKKCMKEWYEFENFGVRIEGLPYLFTQIQVQFATGCDICSNYMPNPKGHIVIEVWKLRDDLAFVKMLDEDQHGHVIAQPRVFKPGSFSTEDLFSYLEDFPDKQLMPRIMQKVQKYLDKPTIENQLFLPSHAVEEYGSPGELLAEVRGFVKKYWDFYDDRGYDIVASWIMATYVPDTWKAVPYLFFLGVPASGKTRALEVIRSLAYKSMLVANTSMSVIFRLDEQFNPTFLLDETEYLGQKEQYELINLLNTRYRRGGIVMRVEGEEKKEVTQYHVFGFTALAGTRGFLITLESRCIILHCQPADRKVPLFIDEEEAALMRSKLAKYREDVLTGTVDLEGKMLETGDRSGLSGRTLELYLPSLVVSPAETFDSILSFARDQEEEKREDEDLTETAEVYYALKELHELTGDKRVPIQSIRDNLNKDRDKKDYIKAESIGWVLKRLGITRKRGHGGKAVAMYNERIMDRLASRFRSSGADEGTLPDPRKNPQNPQNPHHETTPEKPSPKPSPESGKTLTLDPDPHPESDDDVLCPIPGCPVRTIPKAYLEDHLVAAHSDVPGLSIEVKCPVIGCSAKMPHSMMSGHMSSHPDWGSSS